MGDPKRLWYVFDLWVLRILQGILALGIIAAVAIIALLLIRGLLSAAVRIGTVDELQEAVQALFSGVLLVVLGLELMDTLRNYFIEHRVRVEFLITVALIAVARHIIQINYEDTSPLLVGAIALLVFALAASYVAVRALGRYGEASATDPSSR